MKLIIRKTSVRWKAGDRGWLRKPIVRKGALKQAPFSSSVPRKSDSYSYPAELIAAAHVDSFSLALSNELKLSAKAQGNVLVTITVALRRAVTGWMIMNIHLHVAARLPTMTQRRFINATARARTNCLIFGLMPAKISMSAKLEK